MERYKALACEAGVTAYEILDKGIILQFGAEELYLYDYILPGKEHVDQMKLLARKGLGLTTYVNQHVRERYRKKLK